MQRMGETMWVLILVLFFLYIAIAKWKEGSRLAGASAGLVVLILIALYAIGKVAIKSC